MGGIGWLPQIKWHRGRFSSAEGQYADAAMHFIESVRLAYEHKATMIEHQGLVGLASVASVIAAHEAAARLIGATDRSLERSGQHVRGAVKDLYDRTVFASRSAIRPAAFAAARELGGASDYAEWIRIGEAIERAAAERALDRGTCDRAAEPWPRPALRLHVASD